MPIYFWSLCNVVVYSVIPIDFMAWIQAMICHPSWMDFCFIPFISVIAFKKFENEVLSSYET